MKTFRCAAQVEMKVIPIVVILVFSFSVPAGNVYSVKLKDGYWSVSSYTVLFLYLCMQLPRSLAVTMEMFVSLTDQMTGREG